MYISYQITFSASVVRRLIVIPHQYGLSWCVKTIITPHFYEKAMQWITSLFARTTVQLIMGDRYILWSRCWRRHCFVMKSPTGQCERVATISDSGRSVMDWSTEWRTEYCNMAIPGYQDWSYAMVSWRLRQSYRADTATAWMVGLIHVNIAKLVNVQVILLECWLFVNMLDFWNRVIITFWNGLLVFSNALKYHK